LLSGVIKLLKINKILIVVFAFVFIFNNGAYSSDTKKVDTKTIRVIETNTKTEILKKDVDRSATEIGCLNHDLEKKIKEKFSSIIDFKFSLVEGVPFASTQCSEINIDFILNDITYKDDYKSSEFIRLQVIHKEQIEVQMHKLYGENEKFIIIKEIEDALKKAGYDIQINTWNRRRDPKPQNQNGNLVIRGNITEYEVDTCKIVWIDLNKFMYCFYDQDNNNILTTELDEIVVENEFETTAQVKYNQSKNSTEGGNSKIFKIGGFIFVLAAIGFIGYLIKTGKFDHWLSSKSQ